MTLERFTEPLPCRRSPRPLGAQEQVLPIDEYEEDHLPGAISLPIRRIDGQGTTVLDRNRPVIVYCWDVS